MVLTIRPIPKDVPRLQSSGTCHFLKYRINSLSFASEMIAGLSERKVVTIPSDAAPGRRYKGIMSGDKILSRSDTTPNSEKTEASAPVITATAIIKKTVFINRSKDVDMRVLKKFDIPMTDAIGTKIAKNRIKKTYGSQSKPFLLTLKKRGTLIPPEKTYSKIVYSTMKKISITKNKKKRLLKALI